MDDDLKALLQEARSIGGLVVIPLEHWMKIAEAIHDQTTRPPTHSEEEREELKAAAEALRLAEEAGLNADERPYYWTGTLGTLVFLIRLARMEKPQ